MVAQKAQKATVFNGPEQVKHFRLLVIKSRLKLEKAGAKHSQGTLRPRIAAEFGLKPQDSYERFIEVVQAEADKLAASMVDNKVIGD